MLSSAHSVCCNLGSLLLLFREKLGQSWLAEAYVVHQQSMLIYGKCSEKQQTSVWGWKSPASKGYDLPGDLLTSPTFFEQWWVNRLERILFQHHLFPQLKLPSDQIICII